MEQRHRQILQRNRVRLVTSLQPGDVCDRLLEEGVFTGDMIEEIREDLSLQGERSFCPGQGGSCNVRTVGVEDQEVAPDPDCTPGLGLIAGAKPQAWRMAGTRRDQARQLLIDLETRGSDAFHLFLKCLQDTGQSDLADLLQESGGKRVMKPAGDREKMKPAAHPPTPVYVIPEARRSSLDQASKPLDMETDYPMNFDPCGHCLIINNMEFSEPSGLSYRTGSDIDREKLERRMRSYHLQVTVKNNLKAAEIHEELQHLASRDHSECDCCMVVILSHGCEIRHTRFPGGVYGADGGWIPVERIVNYFNGSNCPGLRGKPKLFFIQACIGEEQDRGFAVDLGDSGDQPNKFETNSLQSDATAVHPDTEDTDTTDAVARLPTPGDILVSYSTFPGFVSWREKLSGSWYVETLDDVLDQFARTLDLQTMLVMVADRVSAKGTYKQIPGVFNFLRKRFFFKTD